MTCVDCVKKDVCVLKEKCEELEKHFEGLGADEAFGVTIDCRHRMVEEPVMYGETMRPCYPPKSPTIDPGRIWVTDRTPFDSTRVRW